jgi:hypothetical protein
MLGLVITLVAAAAAPALPGQVQVVDATCADGPACEGEVAPVEYATPAVIDCRSPLGASALFGECDGTPHDASYRVSRFSDGEQRTVELRPGRRDRRGGVAACNSLPPRSLELTLTPAQPAAMYASPTAVLLDQVRASPPDAVFHLPSRFVDPPDRPPRA